LTQFIWLIPEKVFAVAAAHSTLTSSTDRLCGPRSWIAIESCNKQTLVARLSHALTTTQCNNTTAAQMQAICPPFLSPWFVVVFSKGGGDDANDSGTIWKRLCVFPPSHEKSATNLKKTGGILLRTMRVSFPLVVEPSPERTTVSSGFARV
jgi:hypothetical protein